MKNKIIIASIAVLVLVGGIIFATKIHAATTVYDTTTGAKLTTTAASKSVEIGKVVSDFNTVTPKSKNYTAKLLVLMAESVSGTKYMEVSPVVKDLQLKNIPLSIRQKMADAIVKGVYVDPSLEGDTPPQYPFFPFWVNNIMHSMCLYAWSEASPWYQAQWADSGISCNSITV